MSQLIQHFLQRSARLFPQVIVVDDGNQSITYQALADKVQQLCMRFIEQGIQPHQHIAIFSKNSIEYVACYFASAHVGAVLVPLNAHLQPSELTWIINDCNPAAIICDEESLAIVNALGEETLANRKLFLSGLVNGSLPNNAHINWQSLFENAQISNSIPQDISAAMEPEAVAAKDQLAVQMYTSGTTGTPKGVMLSHENVTSVTMAWMHEMPMDSSTSRFMQATPLFHVGGLLMCMCTIATGATLVLLPRFEPHLALKTLHSKHITHALLVPSMVQQVLLLPEINQLSFPNLKTMVYGASSMPQAIMNRAIETFGCGFLQGYGLTETSGVATALRPVDHEYESGQAVPLQLSAAGRELLCCEVRVVNEHMEDVSINQVGEIIVRGSNVTKGYWNNEKATAESIVNGWLKTGDLGRIDEQGYIYVVDRLKDMIDVSGENVYPVEVENVLSGHSQVAEVAVVGLPNLLLGEEVVAVVVAKDQTDLCRDKEKALSKSLKRFASDRLSSYKRPVRYKYMEAIPRTPAGKIKKQVLKKRLLNIAS